MVKKSKSILESGPVLNQKEACLSDNLEMDYCGFRLQSLAKKIKADYLKFRKQESRFINP